MPAVATATAASASPALPLHPLVRPHRDQPGDEQRTEDDATDPGAARTRIRSHPHASLP